MQRHGGDGRQGKTACQGRIQRRAQGKLRPLGNWSHDAWRRVHRDGPAWDAETCLTRKRVCRRPKTVKRSPYRCWGPIHLCSACHSSLCARAQPAEKDRDAKRRRCMARVEAVARLRAVEQRIVEDRRAAGLSWATGGSGCGRAVGLADVVEVPEFGAPFWTGRRELAAAK